MPPRRTRSGIARIRALAAGCLLAGMLAGCSSGPKTPGVATFPSVSAAATAHGVTSFYTPPSPLPPGKPGALIRVQAVTSVPGVPPGAKVWRILYHSRSIYGADIAVSGFLITPPQPAPSGGYPVVAWAHGTVGVADNCAPSLFGSNVDNGPSMPEFQRFLAAGYLIAATDYEGLGTPGLHPYLLGESEGHGVLDAARAAIALPGLHASRTVAIYGHSQGGQAALFAGELAPTYAPDLHVVGVVAAAPATNLSTIISVASSAPAEPVAHLEMMAAYSWSKTYTDLPVTDLFTPTGLAFAQANVDKLCSGPLGIALYTAHLTPADIFPADVGTNPVILGHARLNDPGRVRTVMPMLVVQGTADTEVPVALTDSYVTAMACPIGDTVEFFHVSGATHDTVVHIAAPTILSWMNDRLAGRPAPSTCTVPGDHVDLTR